MPDTDNNDTYRLLAEQEYIQFICDQSIPSVDFFAVPRVDVFAVDSHNGYFGTMGAVTGIANLTAPICYISKQKEVFIVGESLQSFIFPIESIQERISTQMKKIEDIKLYDSKKEAEHELEFIEIPEIDWDFG